jgi:hypothetical protein
MWRFRYLKDALHHKLGGEVEDCEGAEVADSQETGRPLLLILLQTPLAKQTQRNHYNQTGSTKR